MGMTNGVGMKYWIPIYMRMTKQTVIPVEAGIYILIKYWIPVFHAFTRMRMTINYRSRKNEDENNKIESFSEISIQDLNKYIYIYIRILLKHLRRR